MSDLTTHHHGDKVNVGDIEWERTDFPGGDVDEMFRSLQQLANLSGDPTVFPGHWHSEEPSANLSEVKRSNYVYRVSNLDQWRSMMGS
jgi:glyoxylase-like metal-dependent hydrolase (beta-lactamase superfamily II)